MKDGFPGAKQISVTTAVIVNDTRKDEEFNTNSQCWLVVGGQSTQYWQEEARHTTTAVVVTEVAPKKGVQEVQEIKLITASIIMAGFPRTSPPEEQDQDVDGHNAKPVPVASFLRWHF